MLRASFYHPAHQHRTLWGAHSHAGNSVPCEVWNCPASSAYSGENRTPAFREQQPREGSASSLLWAQAARPLGGEEEKRYLGQVPSKTWVLLGWTPPEVLHG